MSTFIPMTADELWRLPSDGRRYELVAGALQEMSPAGSLHGYVVAQLTGHLYLYLRDNPVGSLFGAETGFLIRRQPDTVRAPDVAIVLNHRLEAGIQTGFFPGAPEFVVEVVSPNETTASANEKAQRSIEAGGELVWNIWPLARSVTIHQPGRPVETIGELGMLRGEPLLPGFECRVDALFPAGHR